MEKKMENQTEPGLYRGCIGNKIRNNGKEHGNYYIIHQEQFQVGGLSTCGSF